MDDARIIGGELISAPLLHEFTGAQSQEIPCLLIECPGLFLAARPSQSDVKSAKQRRHPIRIVGNSGLGLRDRAPFCNLGLPAGRIRFSSDERFPSLMANGFQDIVFSPLIIRALGNAEPGQKVSDRGELVASDAFCVESLRCHRCSSRIAWGLSRAALAIDRKYKRKMSVN